MFRASSTQLQEDTVVYMQHMVPSLSMRVPGVLSVHNLNVYRVSQEESARLRESVPYVELYRYNPKHLYPKLNG